MTTVDGLTKKLCLMAMLSFWIPNIAAFAGPQQSAEDILHESGVKGGLVVHLGSGDGRLTAKLRVSDSFLVHGLALEAANVEKARTYIESVGLYGPVSVDLLSGDRLPYIDNLVNLLVAEDLRGVPMKEVIRILCPGGVAYTKTNGKWSKTVKPRPNEIDEWTHFLHDASNNAVAHDSQTGPPRRMKWQSAPKWDRNHHKLASISSVVSAAGRLFYIIDEATSGSMLVPGRWSVAARDAFHGVALWQRQLSSWTWEQYKFRSGPVQLPRLLVASSDSVFAPLGLSAPVSRLDAVTGKILTTYEETAGAEEILFDDGILLVVTGSPAAEQAAIHPDWKAKGAGGNEKSVVAIDTQKDELLWTWREKNGAYLMPLSIAANNQRVFLQAGGEMLCLNLKTGKILWTSDATAQNTQAKPNRRRNRKNAPQKNSKWKRAAGWSTTTVVAYDDKLLWAGSKTLKVLSAKDGKELWRRPCSAGFKSPPDLFVADGLVWVSPDYNVGRNLLTGEVKRRLVALNDLRTSGHHHRCYREKATDNYIIGGHRGMEFYDLGGNNHSRNNWARGTCQYGILPCNGLVYAPSHACGCYMEAKLLGFWALAPASTDYPTPKPSNRLTKGPAYGKQNLKSTIYNLKSEAWPTYRHDPLRTGATTSSTPTNLERKWQTRLGKNITPPVVAGGKVVASVIDAHRVVALSANDGRKAWTFTAGAAVDSPPTIHRGTVLFGSADGYVYCLRLTDGQLIWRFLAAPADTRTVSMDRVESVWPVHGSVLVLDDTAYVTAGRSTYLDGGIFMYALDTATGEVRSRTTICSEHPNADEGKDGPAKMTQKLTQNATDAKTFQAPDKADAFSMAGGTTTDVLVSDGDSIYLRMLVFDHQCARRQSPANHLYSTTSLLDGNENHRSHWMIGTGDFSRIPVAYSWIANRPGAYKSNVSVPYGLLLTFDKNAVWGIRRMGGYTLYRNSTPPALGKSAQQPDIRYTTTKIAAKWQWSTPIDIRPQALVRTAETLLIAGMPTLPQKDPKPEDYARFQGQKNGLLMLVNANDGTKQAVCTLDAPPVWDGLAVAAKRIYISRADGTIECLAQATAP
ncbi:MAG: PQQ-binding-like beta-propeller repeat protein [Planctomycetes bacterium]|nr:PQQ-binding-like beta-propeller repeat protein [Planctomycetota bacterium]